MLVTDLQKGLKKVYKTEALLFDLLVRFLTLRTENISKIWNSRLGSPLEFWKGEERSRVSRGDVSLEERGWKATRATPSLRCVTFELLPLSFDSTTIDAIRSCFGWSTANRVAFVRKVYRERRKISMLPGKGMRNNSRATVVTKGLTLWGTTRHVWFFLKYRFMQSVE